MATIVNFKPAESASPASAKRAQPASCEIILFPGVRYERWDQAPQQQAKPKTSTRKSRAPKRELEMAD